MITPSLTPADIALLRARMGRLGFVSTSGDWRSPAPFVVYSASDGEFYLHSQGSLVAIGPGPTILACLVSERLEPGYCRRILDPAEPVDYAALSPAQRADRDRQRAADAAWAREQDRLAGDADRERARLVANANARGLSAIGIANLSLDDIL